MKSSGESSNEQSSGSPAVDALLAELDSLHSEIEALIGALAREQAHNLALQGTIDQLRAERDAQEGQTWDR